MFLSELAKKEDSVKFFLERFKKPVIAPSRAGVPLVEFDANKYDRKKDAPTVASEALEVVTDISRVMKDRKDHIINDIVLLPKIRDETKIRCVLVLNEKRDSSSILKTVVESKSTVTLHSLAKIAGQFQSSICTVQILSFSGINVVITSNPGVKMNTRYRIVVPIDLTKDITQNRIATSIYALTLQDFKTYTPTVQSLLDYKRGSSFVPMLLPRFFHQYGFTKSFEYWWGPPGTGKTRELANLAKKIGKNTPLVYMTTVSNGALSALSKLLVFTGVPHWLFVANDKIKMYEFSNKARDVGNLLFKTKFRQEQNQALFENVEGELTSFSSIVLMTTSRACSHGVDDKLVRPMLLVLDEQGSVNSLTFVALLRLNPYAVIITGDHKQNPPYNEINGGNDHLYDVVTAGSEWLKCPSDFFGLRAGDQGVRVLGGSGYNARMRMPVNYTKLFGALFYNEIYGSDYRVDYTKDYKIDFVDGYIDTTDDDVTRIEAIDGHEFVINPVSLINIERSAYMAENATIITPFLGQNVLHKREWDRFSESSAQLAKQKNDLMKKVLDDPFPNSYTSVVSQGATFQNVFIDFVKHTLFRGMTNHTACVMFSRHTETLTFSFVPKINKIWLSGPFKYDDNKTVVSNYISFINNISASSFGRLLKLGDKNAFESPLKWRFFVALLEHIWHKQNARGGTICTMFSKLAKVKQSNGMKNSYKAAIYTLTDDQAKYELLLKALADKVKIKASEDMFDDWHHYSLYRMDCSMFDKYGYLPLTVYLSDYWIMSMKFGVKKSDFLPLAVKDKQVIQYRGETETLVVSLTRMFPVAAIDLSKPNAPWSDTFPGILGVSYLEIVRQFGRYDGVLAWCKINLLDA